MIDTTVDVINKLGLHARASGKLIEVTTKFRSSIQIGKGENWSMLKILCHC
jgi:phosphotransferase system HPr (HPr) family protein